jgi:hypothetical protein
MWKREASLPERVANAWTEAGPKENMCDVGRGLDKVMGQLHQWSKLKFGAITKIGIWFPFNQWLG